MDFDILLPIVVFITVVISIFSYRKLEKKIKVLFEDRKFSTRDTILMAVSMGAMVTVIAFAPHRAIQILYIAAYSYIMASFIYVILKKWYVAVFPPILFVLSYFLYWNICVFNLFAVVFAIIITVYLGSLFSWKTTLVFAVLVTVMDYIQVFITGFMGESAGKIIELGLPVLVILPTYPAGTMIGLGLGDIFLSGLLAIQTALKHGEKAGFLTASMITIAIFVFEIMLFNFEPFKYFAATIVVMSGWIASLGILSLTRKPSVFS